VHDRLDGETRGTAANSSIRRGEAASNCQHAYPENLCLLAQVSGNQCCLSDSGWNEIGEPFLCAAAQMVAEEAQRDALLAWEIAMDGNGFLRGGRALAQIESDLLKAEADFAEADDRLKEAERDRDLALDTINQHQLEFDEAVAELRQRSTVGSNWKLDMEMAEDFAEGSFDASPRFETDDVKFKRSKSPAKSSIDDPCVKIIMK
jgi:hypothetical protein